MKQLGWADQRCWKPLIIVPSPLPDLSLSHRDMGRQWGQMGIPWHTTTVGSALDSRRSLNCVSQNFCGCKQALRTTWCSQALSVHPSAPCVSRRKVSQLKGHFHSPSGDVCCSSCSTHDSCSLPGPAGCKQICSLPSTCNAMLSPCPCTQQAEMGFLILTSFPASVRHFPPECSWRAGFSFLLCLLSSHIKLERPFWSLTHSATEIKPPWLLEGKLPPFSGFSGITLCGNAWNRRRNEDVPSCAKEAKPICTDPHVSRI